MRFFHDSKLSIFFNLFSDLHNRYEKIISFLSLPELVLCSGSLVVVPQCQYHSSCQKWEDDDGADDWHDHRLGLDWNPEQNTMKCTVCQYGIWMIEKNITEWHHKQIDVNFFTILNSWMFVVNYQIKNQSIFKYIYHIYYYNN